MHNGRNIKTTIICPWITSTGMFEGISDLFIPTHKPTYVAHRILESIQLEQEILILPSILYILPVTRILPGYINDWIATFTGANSAMDKFRGRGGSWNLKSTLGVTE